MEYLDFEVAIEAGNSGVYQVSVLQSPAGETRETTRFPFDQEQLGKRLADLKATLLHARGQRDLVPASDPVSVSGERLADGQRAASDFGRLLFEVFFTGSVDNLYYESLREAKRKPDRGLRLKLRTTAPELALLPWELIFDPRRNDYVCLSNDTPLVRYLESRQPPDPLAVTIPLRILGMIASPRDLPGLDVGRERARIEEAIADARRQGSVDITWIEGATWEALQQAMEQGVGRFWHVFHFIGHGRFDPHTGETNIALTTEAGERYDLSAIGLSRLLGDHNTLRLAVLNACEGGKSSPSDLFSSTASILVRRGVPAVVSMQHTISDQAAIEFARAFYRSLGVGYPVDAAIAEARKAISLALPRSLEWATPVLHMRSPDGRLFDVAVNQPAPAPARLQIVPPELDFGKVAVGQKPSRLVRVESTGSSDLEWSFQSRGAFFTATRTQDGLKVDLVAAPGTYAGAIQIVTNGATAEIGVRAEVLARSLPAPVSLLRRLPKTLTLIDVSVAALSATLLPDRLIPENLDVIGPLGSLLVFVALIMTLAMSSKLQRWFRTFTVCSLVSLAIVLLIQLTLVCTVQSYGADAGTHRFLIGFKYTEQGEAWIRMLGKGRSCGEYISALNDDRIPGLWGHSYTVGAIAYSLSYLGFALCVALALGGTALARAPDESALKET